MVKLFPFLSLLQISGGPAKVLNWLITIITSGGLIDHFTMSITFLCYHRACVAQGVDRKSGPYYGRFHPWNILNFLVNYTMQLLAPCTFFGWRLVNRTRW